MAQPHLRVRRITQVCADFSRKHWTDLRVLVDLGSLEGQFAMEFALKGAQVVAIEGREENNAKARAAAVSKGLKNIQFVTDDVRKLLWRALRSILTSLYVVESSTTCPEMTAAG